jgi:hypothetical protein
MEKQEKEEFEVKKKVYTSPEFKEYGTFSERTRGTGNPALDIDNGQYYEGRPS